MIKTQNDIQHYKHTHPKTMPQPTKPHKGKASQGTIQVCDARVHYPIIKDQETNQSLGHPPPPTQNRRTRVTGCRRLMPQTPNSASCRSTCHLCSQGTGSCRLCSTSEHPQPQPYERGLSRGVLLRKEVIQPHLPVRLPCYDFVPI